MNRKTLISGYQYFCMSFLFEQGSTSLIAISPYAKQDSWISIMISNLIGCLLFCIYFKLYEKYPEYQLTKYVQFILGKYIGKFVAIIYIVFFIYIGSRILRDVENLLTITLFNSSSLISIGILMMLLVMYGLYKGIETLARTTEVIFILMILSIFLFLLFEVISRIYHVNNLRPVLAHGWEPILKAVFPHGIMFPFGELITFTMILPYLKNKDVALKVGLPALLFSGFILVIFTMKSIAILGVSAMERAQYPILVATSYINIANFVQRLDSFIIILMVCGGFIKLFIYSFCAVSGTADLFNVKKSSKLIYPISVNIVISSLWVASNLIEHRNEGFNQIPYYLHVPIQIIIPISLFIISRFQNKIVKN